MSDFVLGLVIIVTFLVLTYPIGKLINRFKNAGFNRAWAPLIPIIDGQVVEDSGGGGATSWLTGRYKGRSVYATMTPDVRSSGSAHKSNRFGVGVRELAGAAGWRLTFESALAGIGESGWKVRADDRALEERLLQRGVVSLANAIGRPTIRYDTRAQTLTLEEDVSPLWTPPPERFVAMLDLVVRLAAVHDESNAPGR